jgi:hypothetical protein
MRRGGDSSVLREGKVVKQLDPMVHLVHVFKKNSTKRSPSKGIPYLASWCKIHYYRDSGRPIMLALTRLPSPDDASRPKSLAGAKNGQDFGLACRALYDACLA